MKKIEKNFSSVYLYNNLLACDECDVVFHLAAAVGVKLIVESPVRTIETNVSGTEVVLSIANKKKKKVLLASTSEVYGLSTDVPFREDGNLVMGATTKGRWSYACSKAIDEFLALAYWREKKLPTIVVRLFNTVGPRQTGQYGMVIPTFVKQALAGRPITGYGDGPRVPLFRYAQSVDSGKAALTVFQYASSCVLSSPPGVGIGRAANASIPRHETARTDA